MLASRKPTREGQASNSTSVISSHCLGCDHEGAGDPPVIEMSPEEFEAHVDAALDEIPEELARLVQNCVVLVEDEPPLDLPGTLGLYVGIPLTERGENHAGLPDQIFIYRRPILLLCQSRAQVVEEIRITVVHEVAHYFGIDDERLHQLGYG